MPVLAFKMSPGLGFPGPGQRDPEVPVPEDDPWAEVGIFGKLARSRLAQLANASQLSGLFFSSLATASQLGGLRLSSLAVGRGERAMRARHF